MDTNMKRASGQSTYTFLTRRLRRTAEKKNKKYYRSARGRAAFAEAAAHFVMESDFMKNQQIHRLFCKYEVSFKKLDGYTFIVNPYYSMLCGEALKFPIFFARHKCQLAKGHRSGTNVVTWNSTPASGFPTCLSQN